MKQQEQNEHPGWHAHDLSKHFAYAFHNAFCSCHTHGEDYSFFSKIDDIFSALLDNPDDLESRDHVMFLMRSHAAFRTAALLALSGLVPDCAPVARVGLEISLYCFHAAQDPGRFDIWYARNESDSARKTAKDEFSTGRVAKTLEKIAPAVKNTVWPHYEATIDFGAHPNPASLATTAGMSDESLWLDFVSGDPDSYALGFAVVAKTTLATLVVWEAVFETAFRKLDLSAALKNLTDTVHTITPRIIQQRTASNNRLEDYKCPDGALESQP